ncbi:uncharacterized protein OCT59_007079 [Rhizophagus irregularis]|uniref:uncharacterized protein n=1 Tax=Rhizophagus irregularis TaxID=588596 RepID=UPI00332962E3|nr:hypothetical protein OCT59_007079 [Rhizophagus irregularis]
MDARFQYSKLPKISKQFLVLQFYGNGFGTQVQNSFDTQGSETDKCFRFFQSTFGQKNFEDSKCHWTSILKVKEAERQVSGLLYQRSWVFI